MQSTQEHSNAPARFGTLLRLGFVVLVALIAGGLGASGCLDRPLCEVKRGNQPTNPTAVEDCKPQTTNLFVDTLLNTNVDKIDLLIMIDNSTSMADKQKVLADAVPDLVGRLVSPYCINGSGATDPNHLPDPSTACPAGETREFKPIQNIHLAIVSSSLGSQGSPVCEAGQPGQTPAQAEQVDDFGELLGARPRGQAFVYPPGTPGFLDWNPGAHPGENPGQVITQFQGMVTATGQNGCGLEHQLESIYRFLVDPFPPAKIVLQQCQGSNQCAVPQGIEQNVLAQRKAFLRADSLVLVMMLTDENDDSVRASDQYYYEATLSVFLPQAADICSSNPNDKCCYSCGLPPPQGCTPDPKCASHPSYTQASDPPDMRQILQKRRFGIQFQYPIKRYVNAFTQNRICTTIPDLTPVQNCPARPDKTPGLVANPLFQDLANSGLPPRPPSLIYLAGIVGVPWQDIVVDPNDQTAMHFKTAAQMAGDGTWDAILGPHNEDSGGDDNGGQPPVNATDQHMVESIPPRPGLPGPGSAPNADPINGHEWANIEATYLQYACIFDLPPGQTRPCTSGESCDCYNLAAGDNNPLCADPQGNYGTTQYKAKAYPCLRELQLLHDFGSNAIVASICARNLHDTNAQDYGYRPAVDSIVSRLKEALTGKCTPRTLDKNPDGSYPCSILEATQTQHACDPAQNRSTPDPKLIQPAKDRLAAGGLCDGDPSTTTPDCNAFSFCEIGQSKVGGVNGTADQTCANSVTPDPNAIGWCYIDPFANPPIGSPELVKNCPPNEKHSINIVGKDTPARGGIVLIACLGSTVKSASTAAAPAPTMTTPMGGADATP